MENKAGPLTGVKVVACSTAQAGTVPYMLMADLGADAILIGETLLKAGDKSDQIIKEMSSIRKNEN